MRLFKRIHRIDFIDPSEERFDAMMGLVKDLSRKDYNKLKKAMDSGYEAYQIVRGIDNDDGLTGPDFLVHKKDEDEATK